MVSGGQSEPAICIAYRKYEKEFEERIEGIKKRKRGGEKRGLEIGVGMDVWRMGPRMSLVTPKDTGAQV